MAPSTQQTEITPKVDADGVARAATERAERAERQLAELKKKFDERPKGAKDAELSDLRAQLESLQREREELHDRLDAAATVSKELKRAPKQRAIVPGTHRYRLEVDHYRKGEFMPAGKVITVTDEVPGKRWTPVVARPTEQFVEASPTNEQRASDQQV